MDHKKLVYTSNHSESQRVMCWRIIIEYFGPNVQHISGFENKVYDTISILPYTTINQYGTRTTRDLSQAKNLFATRVENRQ